MSWNDYQFNYNNHQNTNNTSDMIYKKNQLSYSNQYSETKSLEHVKQLVSKFYNELYKTGNDYKSQSNGVKQEYLKIKRLREKEFIKKKSKNSKTTDGMRGLQMATVVCVILYCAFIFDNNPIPIPLIIYLMNETLKKGMKGFTKEKVTLKRFESYRTDSKKGIMKYIKKLLPRCYDNRTYPEDYVGLTTRRLHGFTQDQVNTARNITIELRKLKVFKEEVPNGTIAIVGILITHIVHGLNIEKEKFGIPELPETKLLRYYGQALKGLASKQHKMSSIVNDTEFPENPFKKIKPKKTNQKASVRIKL